MAFLSKFLLPTVSAATGYLGALYITKEQTATSQIKQKQADRSLLIYSDPRSKIQQFMKPYGVVSKLGGGQLNTNIQKRTYNTTTATQALLISQIFSDTVIVHTDKHGDCNIVK